ncbi:MAG TPA: hypothetical protein VND93_24080 [Myxococcales bacterium]|jgi:hypothetical protein|nr:hypothetical protein [Myxococcales bacterium]
MNPRRHPLWRIARLPFPAVLCILLVLTAVNAGLGLAASGRAPLRRTGRHIAELALLPGQAADVLRTWSEAKVLPLAREAVVWDFAFIAGYAAALSIACLAFARRGGWFRQWGGRCAWLALLIGALDVVENVGQLQMILRTQTGQALERWPALTAAFAWPKWVLVLPVAAYLALAVVRGFRRETGARPFARGAGAPGAA